MSAPPGSRAALYDRLSMGLLVLTAVSGIVDAVSFLGLGHIFTANMTGNVAFLAFAAVGAPGISVASSIISTGLAADFALAGGSDPHMWRRLGSIVSLFVGAAIGAVLLRFGLSVPLIVAAVCVVFATVGYVDA
jgi:uncharacterized membrane protein YoaK (UPF0700 family)